MAEHRIIAAGFGGQGILMIGRLLAYAGMMEGKNVSWLPSYGPEMRGGTANCNVIISDDIIGAPIISEATCVIAMNLPSLDRFESFAQPGGWVLVNSSLVPRPPTRSDVQALAIPVNELAHQQGSPRVANVVMLGAYLALAEPVRKDAVIAAIQDVLGPTKQHLLRINLNALDAGLAFATKVQV
ncbi:MAG TPA: 2-oxoacid:acceptor oxidoreductase family protein [Opitutaceae bacterium]|nr:2-oxoacid:acceptor oxidoreductase family protein [Opitutaceae bacterium]